MSGVNRPAWDEVQAAAAGWVARGAIPGLAVGVLQDGEVCSAGWGVTSVENPLPVTSRTLFQTGSITKTFTATAVICLAAQGQLALDAPVRAVVPELRLADEAAAEQVTLRHLLSHMGGWDGDLFHDTGNGRDALPRYVAAIAGQEQLVPVNTHWSYNNTGFVLAAECIERVTGQPYEAAMRALVLAPLGLDEAFFDPADVMTRRFVVGHGGGPANVKVARPWALPRAGWPVGGLTCCVEDLLAYARLHMAAGPELLPAEALAAMRTPQAAIWGKREAMGLSWFIEDYGGVRLIRHGGATNGQMASLVIVPERGFAVAVLTNAWEGAAALRPLVNLALAGCLGLSQPPPQPVDASPTELQAFVGRYRNPFSIYVIEYDADGLRAQFHYTGGFPTRESPPPPDPPPMRLALCADGRLMTTGGDAPAFVDVIRKPSGEIGWVRPNGRLHAALPAN